MHLNRLNCPLARARSSRPGLLQHHSRLLVVIRQSKQESAAADRAERPQVVNSSTNKAPSAACLSQAPLAAPLSQVRTPPTQQQPQQLRQQEKQQASSVAQPRPHQCNSGAIDGDTKIIGLGQRGISATTRLMGIESMQCAEFWVLDTDAKVLSSCGAPNTMRIPVEDDAQLSPAELSRLAGQAAVAAASAAGQRPGSPVATCGVAFLVAGAGGVPGGSTLLLQVAKYLRSAGFFVVAALTRPFEFEGRRKLEEADALIETLREVADLVVVVPQGVLTRAFAELTIGEASGMADTTLEDTCKAILWALNVPEVLKSTAGSMLWHGRDLRQYKRLLSPPLEVLQTCPGIGGLGRGMASRPVATLAEEGLSRVLSSLAREAVAAALESPFLEHAMPRAGGVLCVLSLPQRVLSHDLSLAEGALNDPEKYAIRSAVQDAATYVVQLAGRYCEQVVSCAHVRADWPHTDPSLLVMEASLLVLEDPAAAEEAAAAAPAVSRAPPPATSRLSPSGTVMRSKQPAQQQPQQVQQQPHTAGLMGSQKPPPSQRTASQQSAQQPSHQAATPASAKSSSSRATWSAMSAIAGGSAAAAVGQYRTPAGSQAAAQQRLGGGTGRPLDPSLVSVNNKRAFGFFSGKAAPDDTAAGPSSSSSTSAAQQQQQQQAGEATPDAGAADKRTDGLVARSVDLPPSAAVWRHQQRRDADGRHGSSTSNAQQPAGAPGSGVPGSAAGVGIEGFAGSSVDLDDDDDDDDDEDVVAPARDVKSRVAGMLEQERRQQDWVADRD